MNEQIIHELFDRAAARFPDHTAVEAPHRHLSYAELRRNANRLANFMLANGAEHGSVVAIMADDTVEAVTSVLAVLKAGCAFAPIDSDAPAARVAAMVAQARPSWFIVEAHLWGRLREALPDGFGPARVVCIDDITLEPDESGRLVQACGLAEFADDATPPAASGPEDLSYVYFTSGSTGRPKGIAGRLKGIAHFINWELSALGLGEGVRVSQLLPLSFDGSLRDIFAPLCAGGTVCVPGDRETLLDARRLIEWLTSRRVNVVHCVPSLFRSLLNEGLAASDFQALRYVLMAGEAVLGADVGKWFEVFGDRVQLINLYGTSETTMAKFTYFVRPSDAGRRAVPIGRPMEGAKAVLVDEKGNPCPAGVVGEIYIRTPYRSLGYINDPELTAEVFIPNPFNDDPSDIVYRTGDFGRVLEDGNYEYLGRRDQQVKIRGVRVELSEVESVLRLHPAVRDVALTERQDGGGYNYLCAYVVLSGAADAAELREHVARHLPEYMTPSAFVVMDEFPRTLTGKIDRRALPAPGQGAAGREGSYVAPRTPAEETLAEIWTRLLNVPQVGVNDNFFQLGGHSLLATQLLSRVRDAFGVEVPLRALFESPTVAGLAQHIESVQGDEDHAGPIIRAIATEDDEVELQIARLDEMSDEEVELFLKEMSARTEVS